MTRRATDAAEGDHFAAYLRWDIRTEWKHREARGRGAREYPYAYGSNWKYFNDLIKPNTTLWVFAAPVYRAERTAVYRLPPTLIARLLVERVDGPRTPLARQASPEDYVWVARADRARSEYLPINNAFYALTAARFVNSARRIRKVPPGPRGIFDPANPYAHIPGYLQNIRRLAPGKHGVFEALARQVRTYRTAFISYAHAEAPADSPDFAARLADELRWLDLAPWIDRAFVPAPHGDERFGDPLLHQIIADGLRQSGLMIALTGPLYREHKWTRAEWSLAREDAARYGRLRIVQIPIDGLMDEAAEAIDRSDPASTARRISEWWEQQNAGQGN